MNLIKTSTIYVIRFTEFYLNLQPFNRIEAYAHVSYPRFYYFEKKTQQESQPSLYARSSDNKNDNFLHNLKKKTTCSVWRRPVFTYLIKIIRWKMLNIERGEKASRYYYRTRVPYAVFRYCLLSCLHSCTIDNNKKIVQYLNSFRV